MKIGYIRVNTAEQTIARQKVLMQELGVKKVFIDRMRGKNIKINVNFISNSSSLISFLNSFKRILFFSSLLKVKTSVKNLDRGSLYTIQKVQQRMNSI